jgi:ribosomal protein L35
MKNRKSFLKRFKITKSGKILRRTMGISHFLAKKSSEMIRKKRKLKSLNNDLKDYLIFTK